MSKSQMAFDFGELPQKPAPEKILVQEKPHVPAPAPTPQEKKPVETVAVAPEPRQAQTIVKKPEPAPQLKQKSTRGRKSLKEMGESVEHISIPEDSVLYQKMYYTIGKVAEMFKVNQSLIRLWENEFDVLKPKKNGKGDRLFRPEDIKNIHLIYHLMRERKYTMEGAKDFIKKHKKANDQFATIENLKKLKAFLIEIKANL